MPCIYSIKNITNGKLYIGSALRFAQRKRRHLKDLRQMKHHSMFLQAAFNKYGESNFEFSILEIVPSADTLISREQHWIDTLRPKYNNSKTAGNTFGVKHRPEVVLKNKLRNTGFGNGNCKITEDKFQQILVEYGTISMDKIAVKFNVHRTTIERVLNRHKIAKKNKVYDEVARRKLASVGINNLLDKSKVVVQYTNEGHIINIFNSITEAALETGTSISSIWESCNGITNNGFKGKYFFTYL